MKHLAKIIISLIIFMGVVSTGEAKQSVYAKTRQYLCESTLYGVDYDIQAYVGKKYHCKPIWDEMVREELLSFNAHN